MRHLRITPIAFVALSFAACVGPPSVDSSTQAVRECADGEPNCPPREERCAGTPDDPCPPDAGHPPVDPPAPIDLSPPDAYVEISVCLSPTWTAAIQDALAANFPSGEARIACREVAGVNHGFVGIWTRPMLLPDNGPARDVGLSQVVPILADGETIGARATTPWLQRTIDDAYWAMPHQVNDHGVPDVNGAIHLTDHSMKLHEAPPSLAATVHGYFETILVGYHIQTGFDLTVDVGLSIAQGALVCDPKLLIDVDTTGFDWVSAISIAVGDYFGGFGLLGLSTAVNGAEAPDLPGLGAAEDLCQLMPRQILIPGGAKKLVFTMSRVETGPLEGLTIGGTWQLADRKPSMHIVGAAHVSADYDNALHAGGTYRAATDDLRPPLAYQWTAPAAYSISSTHAAKPVIQWTVPALGDVVTDTVGVVVTDADGHVETDSMAIDVTDIAPEAPDPCEQNHHLPQCQDP